MSLTSLMKAARDGDLEGVRENLREAGKRDEWGWTALMYAAGGGHIKCIPLLEKEIGRQDNFGWTALMLAARNGKTDCARLLLSEAGKQTTKERKDFPPGATALMLEAYWNYPLIVQLLLPYEQGLKDSKGHTAKWHANNSPREGNFTKVRELLEKEGTERIPPPPNPAEMLKLSTEVESLKKELSSSNTAREEAEETLSQMNRDATSLKQQLQKANEEAKKHESLQKAFEQNQALMAHLKEENNNRQARIEELIAEKTSLWDKLLLLEKAQEGANDRLAQSNQEIASLKEQLNKTTEAISHSHTDSEALKRELANQKDKNSSLEKEVVQLKSECQDVKALQKRLEEMEEEKDALLRNLTEAGNMLVP